MLVFYSTEFDEAKMHDNENNIIKPRTRMRPTARRHWHRELDISGFDY